MVTRSDLAEQPGAKQRDIPHDLQAYVYAAKASTLGLTTPDKAMLCYLLELVRISKKRQPNVSRQAAAARLTINLDSVHGSLMQLHRARLISIDEHNDPDLYRFRIAPATIKGLLNHYRDILRANQAGNGGVM